MRVNSMDLCGIRMSNLTREVECEQENAETEFRA